MTEWAPRTIDSHLQAMDDARLALLAEDEREKQRAVFEQNSLDPPMDERSPQLQALRNKVIDLVYSQHP